MILRFPIQVARKLLTKPARERTVPYTGYVEFADTQANLLIRNELALEKPTMICKFGTTELACIENYLSIQAPKRINDIWRYVRREKRFLWWWEINNQISSLSGFFPATDRMLERFVELMLNDIKEIDILSSYLKNESLLKAELAHTKKIDIEGLVAPFRFDDPWTEMLEGKKVLVIHPFEESIRNQYKKRVQLFRNQKVLPPFELSTIKAVQTIADNASGFRNWFEALDYMKDRIDNVDFDIALIGCGAYGLPLAAHVKRLGKKGIHLAGWTQMLFGVYGKRWEESEEYASLINEHWVKPLPSEIPQNFQKVERGCYW